VFAALALGWTPPAPADEVYFLMVFGAQRVPAQAKYSHSFATFVRATGTGPYLDAYTLEAYTISWLPQTLDIRLRAVLPECGMNLDLHSTLRWTCATGQRVSMWGPYRVQRDLYERALGQIALLESGRVRFKAIDSGFPTDRASNCIHAVGSVTEGYRLRVISPSFGETASYYLTRRLEPWIIDCCREYPCVRTRLGLDGYPIVHRELENPRSGVILGAVDRLLGREQDPGPPWGR
jgi:hypothetical protein